jgi:hypothetical protein
MGPAAPLRDHSNKTDDVIVKGLEVFCQSPIFPEPTSSNIVDLEIPVDDHLISYWALFDKRLVIL